MENVLVRMKLKQKDYCKIPLPDFKLLEEMMERQMCKLCLSDEATYMMHPCHHMCYCFPCVSSLEACMICRKKHTCIIKVYKS